MNVAKFAIVQRLPIKSVLAPDNDQMFVQDQGGMSFVYEP